MLRIGRVTSSVKDSVATSKRLQMLVCVVLFFNSDLFWNAIAIISGAHIFNILNVVNRNLL